MASSSKSKGTKCAYVRQQPSMKIVGYQNQETPNEGPSTGVTTSDPLLIKIMRGSGELVTFDNDKEIEPSIVQGSTLKSQLEHQPKPKKRATKKRATGEDRPAKRKEKEKGKGKGKGRVVFYPTDEESTSIATKEKDASEDQLSESTAPDTDDEEQFVPRPRKRTKVILSEDEEGETPYTPAATHTSPQFSSYINPLALPPSPILSSTHNTPTIARAPSAGPSTERSVVHPSLDHVFNFQLVVFQVENTLFQVLRNGFNVPGTIFEAMFALPHTPMDVDSISLEGSNLENPIHLPVKADHFRSFLRILYPFIDQTPVVEFDEWVGVLNLATMWSFQEIRAKGITRLSELIKQKSVLERISLAREYRVAKWLRDGYLELAQERPLRFEELQPAEPRSGHSDRNWEADARKWEVTARTWETLARICYVHTKAAALISIDSNQYCIECAYYCGPSYPDNFLCRCRLLTVVDEVFREELERLKETRFDSKTRKKEEEIEPDFRLESILT